MKLFGYWRSSASYRVRIALNIKGIQVEHQAVNLKTCEQLKDDYTKVNVQHFVPTLELDNGTRLNQSLAILDYLEEVFPTPALLPEDPIERTKIRAAAQMIAADISPIQNLRVLKYIRAEFGADDDRVASWVRHFIEEGFSSLETIAQRYDTKCMFNNAAGYFECCLISQVYNANRYGVDMARFPRLSLINKAALELPTFQDAVPENQDDASA